MRSIYTLLLIFCCSCLTGLAQLHGDWINLGDAAMEENDPYGALRYYEKAMEIDSSKGALNYKYAEALRANHRYAEAARYYYKVYRKDRGILFPEGGIWLATMQKQSGNYDKAKDNWRRVRRQYQDEPDSFWLEKAQQEMRACDLAREWMRESGKLELEKIPEAVNSGDSEFAGYFRDDSSLVFSSLRGEYSQNGELETEVDNYLVRIYESDPGMNSISPLEINLFPEKSKANYVRSETEMAAISVSDGLEAGSIHLKKGGNWIQFLPQYPEDTAWYSHPSFGKVNSEEVLFFTSNRLDGFGGFDLWYIALNGSDPIPVNCGENINTPGNEVTPFYRKDNSTLYFSSDWHFGLGGYDIFSSEIFEGKFGFPVNLKSPFNTPANDLYYSFNPKVGLGSITSNRKGTTGAGASCCNDLWMFREELEEKQDSLPEIVTLEELNDYLPVTLYFHNDEPNPRTRKETTDLNYLETYWAYTGLLSEYEREYSANLPESEAIEAEEAMDAFFLDEVDVGVKNLELFTHLLQNELEEGAQIELTVKGFASPLAETDYNVNLTKRRISSLVNFLDQYERGALRPYLSGEAENGGLLKVTQIPFGEYVADNLVSDNPNESNAIYSIAAARERKIEIVSVSRPKLDSTLAILNFEREIIDLGSVRAGDSLRIAFNFIVEGDSSLVVDSILTDSEEIQLDSIQSSYEPTANHLISGMVYPTLPSGKRNLRVILWGNIPDRKKELNITFEVRKP